MYEQDNHRRSAYLMSTIIGERRLSKRARWSTATAIIMAGLASASIAVAQVVLPQPDGDPNPPPALAPPIQTNCGPSVNSIVKTQHIPMVTNAVGLFQMPGAITAIIVPEGTSRCVKVLFTAETACRESAAADFCRVQATIGGAPMMPFGQGYQIMDSESSSAQARAYEWIKRVGPGNYNVAIQWGVLNNATTFRIDDWTFDVQVYQ